MESQFEDHCDDTGSGDGALGNGVAALGGFGMDFGGGLTGVERDEIGKVENLILGSSIVRSLPRSLAKSQSLGKLYPDP